MADWQIKQGDAGSIIFGDTLTYSDGTSPNLNGATVQFVMRARSQNAPTTEATATITNNQSPATVQYTPTATDTATAGLFTAYWIVTFSGGQIQRFPTTGYNTVEIQENLETANQTVVELDDLKDYLNFQAADRTHDGELLRFLQGLTPVIESITGPILPVTYTSEQYDGGHWMIALRHRPVISVSDVIEYRGNIAYDLTQISHPSQGTIYSYEFEPPGRIVRRTVGGGWTPFPPGPEAVEVTYTAGRAVIPQNIRIGVLEAVREAYQQTQQAGRPAFGGQGGGAEDFVANTPFIGQLVSARVREFLAPSRRYPSLA